MSILLGLVLWGLSDPSLTLGQQVPLLVFVFWIGFYPNAFFDKMNPALEGLLNQVKSKQQVEVAQPAAPATIPTQPAAHDSAPAGHGEAPAVHEAAPQGHH